MPGGVAIVPDSIEEKDILAAAKRLDTSSAAGLSGISFDLLKYVARKKGFAAQFANFANTMLKHPEIVKELVHLYSVRVIFIEKPDGGARPLQIEETLLRLFHKVLLR